MRIDNTQELILFIHSLWIKNIDLPENVTLEIDSNILKNEISKEVNQTTFDVDVSRGEFYGMKIAFKQ